MILDRELIFGEYLKTIFTKVNKAIGLFRKLQKILPRQFINLSLDHILTLVTLYSTKFAMSLSIKNWKLPNTMQHQL